MAKPSRDFGKRENFSLGERTRLAIARALLQKPDVLLFDEADAHIDAQTFLEILRDIPGYLPSVSIIAVSHIQDGRAYEGFEQVVIQTDKSKGYDFRFHDEIVVVSFLCPMYLFWMQKISLRWVRSFFFGI